MSKILYSFGLESCHFDQTILLKVSIQFIQGVGEKDPMTFCILDLWRGLPVCQAVESARVMRPAMRDLLMAGQLNYTLWSNIPASETNKSSQRNSPCQGRRYRPPFPQASITVKIKATLVRSIVLISLKYKTKY
jgi:hypothetical protein